MLKPQAPATGIVIATSNSIDRCGSQQVWQQELAEAISSISELLDFVGLRQHAGLQRYNSAQSATAGADHSATMEPTTFPLRVTRAFAQRIVKGDANDPLLLQVLPQALEGATVAGYSRQPLDEDNFQQGAGILQKYQGRALLIVTGLCAIHCRYCFRQHFPYQSHQHSRSQWHQALASIRADNSITEVILSGGDPLALNDQYLGGLIDHIAQISHIDTLRIHSRIPIVLPSRITHSLMGLLNASRLNIVVVVHSNHANEIDTEVGSALSGLKTVSAALLNQTVLLKGVNDSSDTLINLSRALFRYGALPYYLHMLDKVSGSSHFETKNDTIERIMPALRSALPGYLVPKPVREIPGQPSKTPIWA